MRWLTCLLLVGWLGCTSTSLQPRPAPTATRPQPTGGVSGRVLRADGGPLSGVRVALTPRAPSWDLRTDAPAARVETDAEGGFAMEGLAPGEYGLTALTSEGLTVFGVPVQVKSGGPQEPVDVQVGAAPRALVGAVVDEAGAPVLGTRVRVVRPGMPSDDVVFLEASPEGRFQVRTSEGSLAVIASAPGFTTMMVRVPEGQERLTVRLERAPDAAMRRAAVDWVKRTGVPLRTVEAGRGFEDLLPLEPVLEGVRVVALGEATHGTREFFQLKHRLLEFLVERRGFTVFALESGFAEMLALDTYVLTGEGDPARLLRGETWDTQEVLALVRWMRAYNADPAHPRKVRLLGVDMQFSPTAAARVDAWLKKVDPEAPRDPLPLLAETRPGVFLRWPPERKRELRAQLEALATRLDGERIRSEEWAVARQCLRMLLQAMDKALGTKPELRDEAMASNLLWALERGGPETRAVLWAHNGHVQRGPGEWSDWPMGRHLAATLGDALYVFGFAFHQGAFQAWNMDENPPPGRQGMVEFSVPPSPEDTLDAVLAATGWPLLAVDLRALPRSGPAYEWWRRRTRTHDVGALFSDGGYPALASLHPLALYDGLLFVERTTRARPNPPPP